MPENPNRRDDGEAPKKKKGFFRFYDSQKVGKGVPKAPPMQLNFVNFFKLYGRNLTLLLKINLLMVFGNFPFLFALYALTGNLNVNSFGAASPIFPQLWGAMEFSQSVTPASMALFGVHGVQSTVSLMTPATIVFFCLSLLVALTSGPVNVGVARLLRSILRGEPIFFFQDFFDTIKKSLRQSIIVGVLDCAIFALLGYNIILSYFNIGTFAVGVVFYANLMILFVYIIMRFYIFLMLATFNLSIWKLYKNAFIFSILGGKRNLLAVSGMAIALILNYSVIIIILPLGVILPFFITVSTCAFMGAYAAYPKIKEIMIDPYYKDEKPYSDEQPVFVDRG